MASTEQVRLQFIADVESIKKSMLAGGASTKDVTAALKELTKAYNLAEKAAKKQASEAGKIGSEVKAGVGVAQRLMAQFGGSIGAVGGQMAQLTEAASIAGAELGAMGVAGIAATAGVLAVAGALGGYLSAMDALAGSTETAIARLAEIEGAGAPAMGAAEATEAWNQATLRLEASTAKLTTQIGAGLLPMAADLMERVATAAQGYSRAWDAISTGTITADQAGRSLLALYRAELQVVFGLDTFSDAEKVATNALEDHASAAYQAQLSTQSFASALSTASDLESTITDLARKGAAIRAEADRASAEAKREWQRAQDEAAQAAREAAAAEEAALNRVVDASADLQRIRGQSNSDLLTREQQLTEEYRRQGSEIDALERSSGDRAAADAARADAAARYERDLGDVRWEEAQAGIALEDELNAKQEEAAAAQLERQRAAYLQTVELIGEAADQVSELIGGLMEADLNKAQEVADEYRAAADEAQAGYDDAKAAYLADYAEMSAAERAHAEEQLALMAANAEASEAAAAAKEEAEAAAAKKMFAFQVASAIANAGLDAARAAMALIPAYWYLGPGAPAAAAATAGTALGVQLTVISSTMRPTYHTGVADVEPDEIGATLRRGESVLTPAATAAMGADEIDRMNSGRMSERSGDVVVQLDRRLLGRAVGKVSRKGGRKHRIGVAPSYRRT